MDDEYNKKQKKLMKNHIREFYKSDNQNKYNYNQINNNLAENYTIKDKNDKKNYKFREFDEIEEEIIIDQSNNIKKSFEKNNLRYSKYDSKENNEDKEDHNINYLEIKKNNITNNEIIRNEIKLKDKNLLLNIANKTPSQLKLEKQIIDKKFNKSNVNSNNLNNNYNSNFYNEDNEKRKLSKDKHNKTKNFEIDERNRNHKILKNKNNNFDNETFNFQADLKIEILDRIRIIEEKEKLKEKEKDDFINDKNYLKNRNPDMSALQVNENEHLSKSDDNEYQEIEQFDNMENKNLINLHNEKYNFINRAVLRDENYSNKKLRENIKVKNESSLLKDNFTKLNKIKLLLSQKFLNIIVSIISSKLKKYFLIMFENAKYMKIKRLGFDIGEKNAKYKPPEFYVNNLIKNIERKEKKEKIDKTKEK